MRHLSRHTHQTMCDHLVTRLTALGWITDNPPTPTSPRAIFGATPVTFVDHEPQEAGPDIAPNTVAFSIGQQGDTLDEELGAGMQSRKWQMYVDVYAESESVWMALCDDIKDELEGLRLAVNDYTSGSAVPTTDHFIEIELDLNVDEPPAAGQFERTHWRVVTGPLTVYFTGGS